MIKKYGKLIRDNIPSIIKEQGKTPIVRVLSDDEYKTSLNQKLLEEVNEYLENNCLEELCDILEVIDAILCSMNYTREDVEKARLTKAVQNGKFSEKFYLEEVIE